MLANVAGVHKLAVSSLTFSVHRPNILCSTSCDGTVCLWDVHLLTLSSSSTASVETNRGLLVQFQAHTLSVNHALFTTISPNYLLSASDDRTIAMWDISSVISEKTPNASSSQSLANMTAISVIRGFGDAVNKMIELPCSLLGNNNDNYESVIASACDDGMVYIHALKCSTITETCHQQVHSLLTETHMETRNNSSSNNNSRNFCWKLIDKFWVSTSTVNDLILLPHSRILLTASEDCAIHSWKLLFDLSATTDDRLLASLDEFENPVNHIALIPLECFVTDAAISTHAVPLSTSTSIITHHIRPVGVARRECELEEEKHTLIEQQEHHCANNGINSNSGAVNVISNNIRTPYSAEREQPHSAQANMHDHHNHPNANYEEGNEEEEDEVAGAGNTSSESTNVLETALHHAVHSTLPYLPSGSSTPIWVIAACSEFVFGVDIDPNTGVFGSGACSFVGHTDYIRGLEFTANNTLLTVSDDTTAMEWNVASHEPIRVIKLHESEIMSSAINASGDVLATGSESGEVRLWKLPFATEQIGNAHTQTS